MIRINLKPLIIQPLNRTEMARDMLVLFGALFLINYGATYYSETITEQANSVRTETQAKQTVLRAQETAAAKLRDVEKDTKSLADRVQKLKKLGDNRQEPVMMLDLMQKNHHPRLWLTSLTYAKELITVDGLALDHQTVSEYAQQIKNINGGETLLDVDFKNFDPEFAKPQDTLKTLKDIERLRATKMTIIGSTAQDVEKVPLQQFQFKFAPTLN